jgi:hypothetical protein
MQDAVSRMEKCEQHDIHIMTHPLLASCCASSCYIGLHLVTLFHFDSERFANAKACINRHLSIAIKKCESFCFDTWVPVQARLAAHTI